MDADTIALDGTGATARRVAIAMLRRSVQAGVTSADALELDLVSIHLSEALTAIERIETDTA